MAVMDMENPGAVLITGGRGFIGRSLGKLLQRKRYRVISVDVTPSRDEVVCDVTDSAALNRLLQTERVDAIVHLAAVLPTAAGRQPLLATRVNVEATVNLLELAREFGVRRYVFGSSFSVYGTCPIDQIVVETDRAAPEDLYGTAKVYVEQLGTAYRQAHGLEFVSLRIGRVVGPGAQSATSAWRSLIFERLSDDLTGEIEIPYRDSDQILLVHVEDVARMMLRLIEAAQPEHSVYNAACESVTVGALKSEMERLNPRVIVRLKEQAVVGNPRRVDWSRFAEEFGFEMVPIFEQLAGAVGKGA
jgi:nucleoside-diphosphate-sugar epimerase